MCLYNVQKTKVSSLFILLFLMCYSRLSFAGFPYDFSDVNFVHNDISSWRATSELEFSVDAGTITFDYDRATIWPSRNHLLCTGCNANPWVVVKFDDQWWAATFDWLRFGQKTKPLAVLSGDNIKGGPFLTGNNRWQPVEGETYGFFVSGFARFSESLFPTNIRERTNVVMYKWGEGIVKVTPLDEPEETCLPIKSKEGKVAIVCL